MADVLDDLNAKLDRAEEHIKTLRTEIERLLEAVPSRQITEYDPQAKDDFQNELSRIVLPMRTRIIAGEAVHQMRSSLDHLVAKLVAKNNANTDEKTEFPIFNFRPVEKKDVKRYEGKVRGVADPAKALIESLQPYNRRTPLERQNNYLTILKTMDNRDKHRAPVMSVVAAKPSLRIVIGSEPVDYLPDDPTEAGPALDADIKEVTRSLTPHIVFPEFGMARDQPVTDGLLRLLAFVKLNLLRQFKVHL
jgi:hypothetical protein